MATLTLKGIPEALYERLKVLARIRHRSLNSEIIYNLEKSTGLLVESPEEISHQAAEFRSRLVRRPFTNKEIESALGGEV